MLRNVFLVLVLLTVAATSSFASTVRAAKAHTRASKTAVTRTRAAARHAAAPRALHSHKTAAAVPAHHVGPLHSRRRRAVRTSELETRSPRVHGHLRRASFRTMRLPASPLKGSLESLMRQNEMTESDGLERILDETDLASRIEEKLLVPVPSSSSIVVSESLSENHRYCRPWTAAFLKDLANLHSEKFAHPLFVSSAVRTVEYQKHLMRHNGNAAAAEGDIVSPHLTGATIDIAKKGMSRQEITWMRDWLLPLQQKGVIDVEEEFRQSCFHITVYKAYVPPVSAPESTGTTAETIMGQPSR